VLHRNRGPPKFQGLYQTADTRLVKPFKQTGLTHASLSRCLNRGLTIGEAIAYLKPPSSGVNLQDDYF